MGTYEFVHASLVDDDGHGDAEHGEDPQVPRGEPETLLQHLSRRAVRLDELVRDHGRGGPGSSSHCEARKNAGGRSGLVRGRSFGGVAGSSARGGAFARGNDWYAMEAPAHALLARLCERAGLRRARQCDRGEKPNRWKKAAGRSVRMGKQSPAELARGSSSADVLTNLRKLRVFRARTTTSHSHILAPAMGVKPRVRVAGVPGPARALESPRRARSRSCARKSSRRCSWTCLAGAPASPNLTSKCR